MSLHCFWCLDSNLDLNSNLFVCLEGSRKKRRGQPQPKSLAPAQQPTFLFSAQPSSRSPLAPPSLFPSASSPFPAAASQPDSRPAEPSARGLVAEADGRAPPVIAYLRLDRVGPEPDSGSGPRSPLRRLGPHAETPPRPI
jgi:hypothetical protein